MNYMPFPPEKNIKCKQRGCPEVDTGWLGGGALRIGFPHRCGTKSVCAQNFSTPNFLFYVVALSIRGGNRAT